MKKLITLSLLILPFLSPAQFGNILNKAKNKVQQRVDNHVDKSMDNGLDKLEGKETAKAAAPVPKTETKAAAAPAPEETLVSYSKYDFVPGERILYTEDFSQDAIGELPLNWNTSGKGEVVTLNSYGGKWLRIYQNALYLTANKDSFSKNFTIEFDMVLQLKPNGWLYPELDFGFLSTHDQPSNDNFFLREYDKYAAVLTSLHLGEGGNTRTKVESYLDNKKTFYSENQNLASLEKSYNKIAHVSMQVQEKRLRVWFNGEKKFDIPMAVPQGYAYNQLFFKLSSSNYKDDMLAFYIGNVKVATGKPDTRHKLVDEGKFSTTGILFDNASAVIRPESAGVLKEIGSTLTENNSLKIKIIGHTSSDGDDAANLELSRQRAAAVKEYLTKEFSIDASRMETEGKGETKPVGDNKTKEGRAMNRRVEFIKI
jgi:outer membrane protein OmpA-like peptidoglycan-associated protein